MILAESHVDLALAQQRPVYRAASVDALTSVLLAPFDDLEAVFRALVTARETGLQGTGVALDLVGGIVSAPRNGLDDVAYRLVLAARIAELNSSGTPEDLIAVTRSVISQDPVHPSTVIVRRGAAQVGVEMIPDEVVPADWVPSPAASAYVLETLDGGYAAGSTVIGVVSGTWPEVGRFAIDGGAYSGQTFSFIASASRLTLTIYPPLPYTTTGLEALRGPLGMDMAALRYLWAALVPAVLAGDAVQASGGLTGPDAAFALASAIATSSAALAGDVTLATSPAATAQLPATGYCHPAGSPVTRYHVIAPGVLSLDSALVAGVAAGAVVPLVNASGASWRPGLGLGAGALYGVAASADFVPPPDCNTSLNVDGPGITFPISVGSYGCVLPVDGIPHPDAMIRFDEIAGAASGTSIPVDKANSPRKEMIVAGTPLFRQTIAGWASRAMTLPQTLQTGLRVPLDLDGAWFDVGRQDVAALCWFGASSSGGNRTFLSLAGLSIQLRITAVGKLSLFTTGGDTVGTFDYRHAGTLTIHPFLIALKRSTQQIKVWTDKEVLTGVWTYAGDAEKGLYAAGQTPPVSAWIGFDLWKGSKATAIFDLGDVVLRRLNWAMAY